MCCDCMYVHSFLFELLFLLELILQIKMLSEDSW